MVINQRMTPTNKEEDYGPAPPGGIPETKDGENDNEEGGNHSMETRTEGGVDDVATVELTDRKKVHGCGKEPNPGGHGHGMQNDSRGLNMWKKEPFKQLDG